MVVRHFVPLFSSSENLDFNAIMIIKGFTIAIMSLPQGYFIFDSHSRNAHGLLEPSNGKSCLLKFDNIFEFEKYIHHFYLVKMESERAFFEIQFVQICELQEHLKTLLQQDFSAYLNASIKRKNDSADEGHITTKRRFNFRLRSIHISRCKLAI